MIIAILGYGSIGKYYLSLVRKYSPKKIYIIDDKIKIKKNIKNCVFIDFDDFKLNNIKVKFAIICTPSFLHFEHAKYFLNANTNVLIEKPFVLKYNDALYLKKIATKKNIRCWTVFQNRYNPSIILLNKLIKKNYFKKINLIMCKLLWSRDLNYYKTDWRGVYKTDGGVLSNQAIHLLDILTFLFGEIKNFNGIMNFNKNKLEAEDYISLNLNLKSNVPTTFVATTRSNQDYEMSIDVIGSKKRIKIGGLALNSMNFFDVSLNKKYKNYSYKTNKGYGKGHKELIKDFLNLRKNDKFNLSIDKNIYLIKLINSIYYYLINSKNKFQINKTKSVLGYGKKK